jgi:hypothetical protein
MRKCEYTNTRMYQEKRLMQEQGWFMPFARKARCGQDEHPAVAARGEQPASTTFLCLAVRYQGRD